MSCGANIVERDAGVLGMTGIDDDDLQAAKYRNGFFGCSSDMCRVFRVARQMPRFSARCCDFADDSSKGMLIAARDDDRDSSR